MLAFIFYALGALNMFGQLSDIEQDYPEKDRSTLLRGVAASIWPLIVAVCFVMLLTGIYNDRKSKTPV